MRFPGLKSRKSSSSNGVPSTSPPDSSSTAGAATLQPVSSNGNSNTGSTSSLLSRWKSNVDEHGVLRSSDAASSSDPPPASASSTTTANTGKRSLFSRKSHTRSVSSGAQEVLDSNVIDNSGHSRNATISNVNAAAGGVGGHPLRQNTLPADLDATPQKAKRPGLSFSKRGFTVADASSSSHLNNNDANAPRKSFTSSSYHASSPTSHTFDSADTRPLSRTQDSPASRSSDSFQLKSFRSVTGVREEPTLSSLVDAELTHSPLSTRPSSPATAPASSTSSTSYFDSRLGGSTSSGSRTPNQSNASISVSRFREARAVRSSSSLNSNASQATAHRQSSGLKLDLPPPISLEYPSRPVLNIVQPDSRSPPSSRPTTPANKFATSEDLSRASSASPSRESYTTAYNVLHASPPRMASPTSPGRSLSSSLNSHEDRHPAMHPLAAHPDNALPLPPLPVDPAQQQRQHRRTVSNQSVSSISASLGGWLNSTTTTFGLSFSAEDVQKALVDKAAALRSRSPTLKDGFSFGSNTHDRSMSQQQVQEEEVIMSPAQLGPTREELAILLGGKVLPPPPSETGDDYDPRSPVQASPKIPLSRASSYSNLGFGANLFASTFAKAAKPARDDDDESDNSRDVSLVKALQARPSTTKRASRASNAFDSSDTSSDEAASDIEEEDSDDSEARAKKKERTLVFPPPRPVDEADRQRIYRAALTPPTLTPQGSSSDLKAFVQPVPPTAPLTSANIKALAKDDEDDDEDVPLSTIKLRAQSEVGIVNPHLRPSAAARGLQVPFGGSTVGLPSRSPYNDQRGRLSEKRASTSSLAVPNPSPSSSAMPRSLSAFNIAASGSAPTSRQMQARSASSHAISALASPSTLPRHVSLSSLIELEAKNAEARLPVIQKKASTASSRPSNSSDGSFPPTPSDTAPPVNKRASKSTLFPPTHLSPIRKQKSSVREHKATASIEDARRLHPSSPSSKIDSPNKAKAGARRSLAYGNGNLATMSGNNVMNPNPGFAGSYGMPLSPQALQGMSAPPGVDPALYASLPPDQKLNLQMRAQQLLSVMQGMALQAQNGTLGAPPQFPSHSLPSSPYGFLPMQMQMPMMGSTVPAFPPFPNFFGMPAGFPNNMPPFYDNMTNMQSHQNFVAPSAIGQPTLLQQAGLSTQGTNTLSVPSQHHRRKSQ